MEVGPPLWLSRLALRPLPLSSFEPIGINISGGGRKARGPVESMCHAGEREVEVWVCFSNDQASTSTRREQQLCSCASNLQHQAGCCMGEEIVAATLGVNPLPRKT